MVRVRVVPFIPCNYYTVYSDFLTFALPYPKIVLKALLWLKFSSEHIGGYHDKYDGIIFYLILLLILATT